MQPRNRVRRMLLAGALGATVAATSCGTGGSGGSGPTSVFADRTEAIIVTRNDLPSSWTERGQSRGGEASAGSCLDSVTMAPEILGLASRTAAFAQSDLGPFLVAVVAAPPDNVEGRFGLLTQRLGACNGTRDDAGFTTTIDPLKLPEIGDATFAAKATARNPTGSTLSYLIAMARVETTIVVAAHIVTLGELDAELVQDVLQTMIGRS